MEPIRVCLLVNSVGENAGAERQVVETAMRLDPSRFRVYVCCFENSPPLENLAAHCQVRVFPLMSVYTANGLGQMWSFRRFIAREKIHIVHAYMEKNAVFGALALAGNKNVILITSRLNLGYWYTPFYRKFFRILNQLTTRIMANAENVKAVTIKEEGAPPEKIDVLYQGVDTTRFGSGSGDLKQVDWLGIPEQAQVVGIVANLRPVKDLELFLKAASLVAKEIPDTAFLLAGTGSLRETLEHLAKELGIRQKVFFTDGRKNVQDYLRRMSIGCLSSKSEGFSNAILEYMATGLPVVAMDVGGNREAILDGQTGYLVRERSPEAFAEKILILLRDPAKRLAMGHRGMERCQNIFDLRVTIKKLEDYYLSLLKLSA